MFRSTRCGQVDHIFTVFHVSLYIIYCKQCLSIHTYLDEVVHVSYRTFPLRSSIIMVSVLVPIADGSEEIETVCIVDTLVRAGAEVTVASVMPGRLQCTMSRGLKIVADVGIQLRIFQQFSR